MKNKYETVAQYALVIALVALAVGLWTAWSFDGRLKALEQGQAVSSGQQE